MGWNKKQTNKQKNTDKKTNHAIYYSYFITLLQIIDFKINKEIDKSKERKEEMRSPRKSLSQCLQTVGALLNPDTPTLNHGTQERETKPRKVLIFLIDTDSKTYFQLCYPKQQATSFTTAIKGLTNHLLKRILLRLRNTTHTLLGGERKL